MGSDIEYLNSFLLVGLVLRKWTNFFLSFPPLPYDSNFIGFFFFFFLKTAWFWWKQVSVSSVVNGSAASLLSCLCLDPVYSLGTGPSKFSGLSVPSFHWDRCTFLVCDPSRPEKKGLILLWDNRLMTLIKRLGPPLLSTAFVTSSGLNLIWFTLLPPVELGRCEDTHICEEWFQILLGYGLDSEVWEFVSY
jgi:hypothetical protein